MHHMLLGLAVAGFCWGAGVAEAASVRRPADSQALTLKQDIGRLSSATGVDNQIVRDSLRVPFVPANQVTLVSQETTCKKANTAFQSFFANTGNRTFSGQVYVLQVGTVYAVIDPAYRHDPASPVGPILFLDSRFKPLSTTT